MSLSPTYNSLPPPVLPRRVWLYVMGVATDTIQLACFIFILFFFLDGREDAAPSRCPLRTHGFH